MTEKNPWLSITEGNVKIAECDVPYLSPLFKVGSVIQKKSSKYKQGQKGQCLFGSYCILLQTYHESIIWEFIIIRTKY